METRGKLASRHSRQGVSNYAKVVLSTSILIGDLRPSQAKAGQAQRLPKDFDSRASTTKNTYSDLILNVLADLKNNF